MALAVAINVSAGTNTSSPETTPPNCKAMCKAAVPFTTATACLAPVYAASSASNRSTYLPTEETKVESRHSLRYIHSLPAKRGSCKTAGSAPIAVRMAARDWLTRLGLAVTDLYVVDICLVPSQIGRPPKPVCRFCEAKLKAFTVTVIRLPSEQFAGLAVVCPKPLNL